MPSATAVPTPCTAPCRGWRLLRQPAVFLPDRRALDMTGRGRRCEGSPCSGTALLPDGRLARHPTANRRQKVPMLFLSLPAAARRSPGQPRARQRRVEPIEVRHSFFLPSWRWRCLSWVERMAGAIAFRICLCHRGPGRRRDTCLHPSSWGEEASVDQACGKAGEALTCGGRAAKIIVRVLLVRILRRQFARKNL